MEAHRQTYAAKRTIVTVHIKRGGTNNDDETVEFEAKGNDTIANKLSALYEDLDVCTDDRYEVDMTSAETGEQLHSTGLRLSRNCCRMY